MFVIASLKCMHVCECCIINHTLCKWVWTNNCTPWITSCCMILMMYLCLWLWCIDRIELSRSGKLTLIGFTRFDINIWLGFHVLAQKWDQIFTFRQAIWDQVPSRCTNSLSLSSMREPLHWVLWKDQLLVIILFIGYELWLMTSQRVLLSVNGGVRLHSCIAQVDFKSVSSFA